MATASPIMTGMAIFIHVEAFRLIVDRDQWREMESAAFLNAASETSYSGA